MEEKKFVDRFSKLIKLLEKGKGNPIIPKPQITELEYHPTFNPTLNITPRDWWINSFEWFVAIEIVQDGSYGPFYRIGEEHFYPQIGNASEPYSERHCFYGLEKPRDKKHAKELYNIQDDTPMDYCHEFKIEGSKPAYIFVGPVKGGTGFQANPNSVTVEIIKSLIVTGKVKKEKLE